MEHPRIEQEREEPATSPTPPDASTQEDGSSSERVPCLRSLQELYEVIENLTFLFLFTDYEPMNFQEVVGNKNWDDTMDEEIKAIKKNKTWELASLIKGCKVISVKWVYKAKKNAKGADEKDKTRLVAKGYS